MNPLKKSTPDTCGHEIDLTARDESTLFLYGDLTIDTANNCLKEIRPGLKKRISKNLVIDIGQVTHMDDYGAMAISEIKRISGVPEEKIEIVNISGEHQKMLDMTNFNRHTRGLASPATPNLIMQAGESTIKAYNGILFFITFIGAITISLGRTIKDPRSLRFGDILLHMKTTGVDALPVIGLISLMLGLIIAFISSMQLRLYGANIYVANLVALAMVSELGPIMTGIIVAGRSGSAYAAEISTMKISEEIDALVVMGFDPYRFLVLPRLIAAIIVIPMLAMFSNIFAIAGGMFIGVFMLQLTMDSYINQTFEAITLFELVWGLSKAMVFGVLIAITGCLRGFQATGGASSVGNAATTAVVTGIFLIILFDSIFAIIRIYWE